MMTKVIDNRAILQDMPNNLIEVNLQSIVKGLRMFSQISSGMAREKMIEMMISIQNTLNHLLKNILDKNNDKLLIKKISLKSIMSSLETKNKKLAKTQFWKKRSKWLSKRLKMF